ncbi:hypothetical protein [Streptomyces sp. NBRC 110028]|uniref:hypothetical protein n=1 Tax=Streptomyces sp. NBRC 110028 TaxID=1621260 RepID=UPI0006E3A93C
MVESAARVAGLVSVAVLPLLVGMGPDAYRSDAAFDASFSRAMPLCAGLLAVGASVAFGTLRQTGAAAHPPHGRTHGWLMEPPGVPLQPSPSRRMTPGRDPRLSHRWVPTGLVVERTAVL